MLGRNFGGLRAPITASKPEATRIRVGSLNARPTKTIPIGKPRTSPSGTLMTGYPACAAGVTGAAGFPTKLSP